MVRNGEEISLGGQKYYRKTDIKKGSEVSSSFSPHEIVLSQILKISDTAFSASVPEYEYWKIYLLIPSSQ